MMDVIAASLDVMIAPSGSERHLAFVASRHLALNVMVASRHLALNVMVASRHLALNVMVASRHLALNVTAEPFDSELHRSTGERIIVLARG